MYFYLFFHRPSPAVGECCHPKTAAAHHHHHHHHHHPTKPTLYLIFLVCVYVWRLYIFLRMSKSQPSLPSIAASDTPIRQHQVTHHPRRTSRQAGTTATPPLSPPARCASSLPTHKNCYLLHHHATLLLPKPRLPTTCTSRLGRLFTCAFKGCPVGATGYLQACDLYTWR